MANPLFTSIPLPKPPRNVFQLSHSNKFTMTAQKLYTTLIKECLPGDRDLTFAECMVRAMPLVAPVYQSYNISHHSFFVPMRTLNKNWENFITGGRDGLYSSVMPYTTYGAIYAFIESQYNILLEYDDDGADVESLTDAEQKYMPLLVDVCRNLDFMGLSFCYQSVPGEAWLPSSAVGTTSVFVFLTKWLQLNTDYADCNVPVNLCPFGAYLKIWSEYYMDQNLEESPFEKYWVDALALDEAVGSVLVSDWSLEEFVNIFMMRPRAWKKDRFTSALPFTQRGPDVLIPIAGTAPVVFGTDDLATSGAVNASAVQGSVSLGFSSGGDSHEITGSADLDNADLSTTINEFRRAERAQRWYESNARGGSRLSENTPAHWGVFTKDATIQRAQFLGGIMQPLVISEVQQTSQTTDDSPQGNLAGKGTSYNNGRLCKHYDAEHGYLICLTSVLQHGDYFQGTPRLFTRQDKFEYAWPEFANLGEEAIKTRELYTLAGNDEVFGYTPRYSDYKSMPNEIHGDMRTSLQHWSVPRTFANKPELSTEFMFNPPSKQAFAVESGETDEFVAVIRFALKSSRLLPFYGVPTI